MTKTKPFLSTCYVDPSATEVPPCCEAATRKLTFSTTSVLLLLDVPLSLSRGTIFRWQKNPRRGYRPKIAGILFLCNEPGRLIPYCAHLNQLPVCNQTGRTDLVKVRQPTNYHNQYQRGQECGMTLLQIVLSKINAVSFSSQELCCM